MITATQNANGDIDLVGKQGTTWEFNIDIWTDEAQSVAAVLTGYSARGQYKADKQSTTLTSLTFTCTISTNRVNIKAAAALSSGCNVLEGVYDIEIYNADESSVERIAEGSLTISQEVTT